MALMRSWKVSASLLLVAAVAGSLAISTPASAAGSGSCSSASMSPHAYSNAGFCNGNATAVWMNGPLDYMATSDTFDYLANFFMNNEFWTFSSYGGGTFVELGITDNANTWGIDPCGCTAYYAFWGDYAPPVYGTMWFGHYIANISPNQSTYYAEVYNNGGSNNWTVYMNYNGTPYYATSTHMYSNTANDEILGSEEIDGDSASYDGGYGSLIDPDESTGGQTFSDSLEVDINGSWSYPPLAGWTNTNACGTGSGHFPSGYCDNGLSFGVNGAWYWNKP